MMMLLTRRTPVPDPASAKPITVKHQLQDKVTRKIIPENCRTVPRKAIVRVSLSDGTRLNTIGKIFEVTVKTLTLTVLRSAVVLKDSPFVTF